MNTSNVTPPSNQSFEYPTYRDRKIPTLDSLEYAIDREFGNRGSIPESEVIKNIKSVVSNQFFHDADKYWQSDRRYNVPTDVSRDLNKIFSLDQSLDDRVAVLKNFVQIYFSKRS